MSTLPQAVVVIMEGTAMTSSGSGAIWSEIVELQSCIRRLIREVNSADRGFDKAQSLTLIWQLVGRVAEARLRYEERVKASQGDVTSPPHMGDNAIGFGLRRT